MISRENIAHMKQTLNGLTQSEKVSLFKQRKDAEGNPLSYEDALQQKFTCARIMALYRDVQISRLIAKSRELFLATDVDHPFHDDLVEIQIHLLDSDDFKTALTALRNLPTVAEHSTDEQRNHLLGAGIRAFRKLRDGGPKQEAADLISRMLNGWHKNGISPSGQGQDRIFRFTLHALSCEPYTADKAYKFIGTLVSLSPKKLDQFLHSFSRILKLESNNGQNIEESITPTTAALLAERIASSSGRIAEAIASGESTASHVRENQIAIFQKIVEKLATLPPRIVEGEEEHYAQVYLAGNMGFIANALPQGRDAWKNVHHQLLDLDDEDVLIAWENGNNIARRQSEKAANRPASSFAQLPEVAFVFEETAR